jgi:starvation-inducible DNA-binding protein
MRQVDIGIENEGLRIIADKLGQVLADTFVLYTKTLNYHWNITGSHFVDYHQFLEKQYKELLKITDEVAERIGALGFRAPGSLRDFTRLSTLKEEEMSRDLPIPEQMIHNLELGREHIIKSLRTFMPQCQMYNDEATFDMLVKHMGKHEKAAWMLRKIFARDAGVVSTIKKWASA